MFRAEIVTGKTVWNVLGQSLKACTNMEAIMTNMTITVIVKRTTLTQIVAHERVGLREGGWGGVCLVQRKRCWRCVHARSAAALSKHVIEWDRGVLPHCSMTFCTPTRSANIYKKQKHLNEECEFWEDFHLSLIYSDELLVSSSWWIGPHRKVQLNILKPNWCLRVRPILIFKC